MKGTFKPLVSGQPDGYWHIRCGDMFVIGKESPFNSEYIIFKDRNNGTVRADKKFCRKFPCLAIKLLEKYGVLRRASR